MEMHAPKTKVEISRLFGRYVLSVIKQSIKLLIIILESERYYYQFEISTTYYTFSESSMILGYNRYQHGRVKEFSPFCEKLT